MLSPDAGIQINIRVSTAMHRGLAAMADKAGMRTSTYAGHLLNAAYAARAKPPSGDIDLDKAVGMVAVLWAEHRDAATIAAVIGLSPATVDRIVAAWQRHHLARAEGGDHG